jgi:hypothetical protein
MAKIDLQTIDADPFVLLAGAILHRAILDLNRGRRPPWSDRRRRDPAFIDAEEFLKSDAACAMAEMIGADRKWLERLFEEKV